MVDYCLRVDWEPPPVLLLRLMTWEELLPLVSVAPGMPPCERPVEVLIPLALPLPVTFLIELFKLVLPVFRITLSTFLMLPVVTPWWCIWWFCCSDA